MDLKRMTTGELEAKIDSEGLKHLNCVSVLIMLDRHLGIENSQYLHLATEVPEEVDIVTLSNAISALNLSEEVKYDNFMDFREWMRQTEHELRINVEVFKEELLNRLLDEKDQMVKWLMHEINTCRFSDYSYDTLKEVYYRFTGNDEV